MSLTRSQEQLRESVRRTADVLAFVDRHPDASINDLINRGLGALHRLTAVVAPEFRPLGSTTITTDGLATAFALPANFRSLLSVEYSGDGGVKSWLTPFNLNERARLTTPDTDSVANRALFYRLLGTNIELLPRPPTGHSALIWYATTAPQLAGNADVVVVMDRLDDYVIWWAAREIAMDRADWERHDRLTSKLAMMEAEIQVLARHRDMSVPARPVNQRQTDRYGRRLWGRR